MKFLGGLFGFDELISPSTWFNGDAAEDLSTGATLNGHVDFIAVGASSFTAHLKEEAALAEAGVGAETETAHLLLRAQVAFAGVAASSFTAHLKEEAVETEAGIGAFTAGAKATLRAAVDFVANGALSVTARLIMRAQDAGAGVGTFLETAHELLRAQLAEAGIGAFTAAGHVVSGASILNGHVDFIATGALAVARPTELLAVQVAFASSASLAVAAPSRILNAQVGFGSTADIELGQVPLPTLGGGGGTPSYAKRQVRRPRRIRLRTSVGFRAEAVFAARADVVPAALPALEVAWPRYEGPTPIEAPFVPAIADHIDPWTAEDELVALLMFEEMAA